LGGKGKEDCLCPEKVRMKLAVTDFIEAGRTEKISLFGLYFFAFGCLLSVTFGYIGFCIMMLGLLLRPGFLQKKLVDPQVAFLLVFGIYTAWRAQFGISLFPETHKTQWREWKSILYLWMFLPVAWVSLGVKARIYLVFVLMILGALVGVLKTPDWWMFFVEQERTGFHLKAIAFSLYACTVFLGLFIFFGKFRRFIEKFKYKNLFNLIYLTVAAFFFVLFVLGKSKTTFLAFSSSFIICLIFLVFYSGKCRVFFTTKNILICMVFIILFGILLSPIFERIYEEKYSFLNKKEFRSEVIPTTAIGYRLKIYQNGLHYFKEKPWLGWGPGSSQALNAIGENASLSPAESDEYFDHFHSLYLEFLVRYGIFGVLIFSAAFIHLLYLLIKFLKKENHDIEFRVFALSFLVLILIYSLFDFRHNHFDFRFYWALLCGAFYSFRFIPC
jgi:hypothetical protein